MRRRPFYTATSAATSAGQTDQGSATGFNGIMFEPGGGDLGASAHFVSHADFARPRLDYDGFSDPSPAFSYHPGVAEQLAAQQQEIAHLQRQNQALVAANDARQQTAVKILSDLFRDGDSSNSGENGQSTDSKHQLTRLLLALLDSGSQASLPFDSLAENGAQMLDNAAVAASPNVGSAKTRVCVVDDQHATAAAAAPAEWDTLALLDVARHGRVAPTQPTGDKYAAESLRALGTRSTYHNQHQPPLSPNEKSDDLQYGDDNKLEDRFGVLAQSLLSGDESFVPDPSSRFILYSPSAGIFQARTLDGLGSGSMSLADIIEASNRSLTLDRLERERQELVSVQDGDALQFARKPAGQSQPLPGAGCFWLDATDATVEEMASLARVFGIHPLTVEDIVSDEDSRDKCETFGGYHFLAYRTVDHGAAAHSIYEFNRGAEGIATTAFSIVLKQHCVLTFHCARELEHIGNVVARLNAQAPSTVTAAYIAYAIVDDITDILVPEMRAIELEVDAVDELVLILSTNEQADMLQRIGAARRKILTIWRLLQGKPDVIRAFSKLLERQAACDDALRILDGTGPGGEADARASSVPSVVGARRKDPPIWLGRMQAREKSTVPPSARPSTVDLTAAREAEGPVPADEVAHYLSDVYDHVVALLGSSSHCDMVLSRAHSNYLARISLELGESTVETNLFASRWTVIGAIFVPLNVVTGLFGMNVVVPGARLEPQLST